MGCRAFTEFGVIQKSKEFLPAEITGPSQSAPAVSNSTMLPSSTRDSSNPREFDTFESCGLSPAALQKIREQMALSLERTRELEEQVKLIPTLKVRIFVATTRD